MESDAWAASRARWQSGEPAARKSNGAGEIDESPECRRHPAPADCGAQGVTLFSPGDPEEGSEVIWLNAGHC